MKNSVPTPKFYFSCVFSFIFGVFLASPLTVLAEEKIVTGPAEATAAVWDLANLSKPALSDETIQAITQYVGVKVFSIMPDYRWLDRGSIKEVLEEQKFQASGCTDQSCVVEMGQLLGARKMVTGSIGRTGNTYNLTLSVIDIQTGLIDKTASEICPACDEGQLYQLAEKTVLAMSGRPSQKMVSNANLVHKNRVNIDINYPGFGARYFFSNNNAVELRGQYVSRDLADYEIGLRDERSALVMGARLYRYMASSSRTLRPYLCLEMDYIRFFSAFSEGDGYSGGAFGGIEYFIGRGFSIQTDVGASYIYLRDKNSKITDGGVEYIMNFGINVYFNG